MFNLLPKKLKNLFALQDNNVNITPFVGKIFATTLAFLILMTFVPVYQETEGYYAAGEGLDIFEFTDRNPEYTLADVMTEDGFLLKPAINSSEGDRNSYNEIFAYTVKPGDTLSAIAQRFNIKKETLIWENNLWNANYLRTGSIVKILPVNGVSHRVKKGDNLDKIAKKYNIKKEDIIRQNQLEEVESLVAKTILVIPGAKKTISYANRNNYNAPTNAALYNHVGKVKGQLLWPTTKNARLTQYFHRGHYAIDISNRARGPIFASAAGKIIRADYGWNGGYGNVVIVDHGNGMETLYGHNEKIYVTVGQYVEQGQSIAWMGNSGRVYGPTGIHLHFEVRINGVKYNPMTFF